MSAAADQDSLKVLLAFYEENARQARYHGMQRQAVAATVLLAAVLGLLVVAVDGAPAGLAGVLLCAVSFSPQSRYPRHRARPEVRARPASS